jgi:adenylate cyclase
MTTRRLAAILAADVVGFSSMMERDEEGTLRLLKATQRDLIEPRVRAHHGRIVKTTGDGFLIEFGSPLDAVRCALEVQEAVSANGEPGRAEEVLRFRMGINLGDIIIEEDGDIYGDGVNVAARLEQIAGPGTICISGKVFDEVEGKLTTNFAFTGEQQVKNLTRPVRVYSSESETEPRVEHTPLPLPDKPSIAVLPFTNMSNDPEQEYFADGIAEDIITALSSLRWLFVIARNSSFTYKGHAVDIKRVGRELGVRYVLEGSVRRAASRVRVTTQLIDAVTGGHHWAERYDRDLVDIFALQDDITRSVAAAIEPRLIAAEGVRSFARSPADLGAWELVAQALAYFWRVTRTDHDTAVAVLTRAARTYPDYAPAHSLLAFCWSFASHMGWSERDQALSKSRSHSKRALQLDATDPWAHLALGYEELMEGRIDPSIAAFRRAIELNPNSAEAHSQLGRALVYAGRDEEALAEAQLSIRLSPRGPQLALFTAVIGLSHWVAGRYDDAIAFLSEALKARPEYQPAQRALCVSLANAGRLQEAQKVLALLICQQPGLSIAWVKQNLPFPGTMMERYLDGLRKAGLPE